MTEQEALKIYEEMTEMFGELPNPDHHPRMFAYYFKLYMHCKKNGY